MEVKITDERQTGRTEQPSGKYTEAVFNPDLAKFDAMLSSSGRKILEVGCGFEPRMSWQLDSSDIWVGCDPAINSNNGSLVSKDKTLIRVHNGGRKPGVGAKLVVFSNIVAGIPKFKPDVISFVAPNQQDVANERILNYELDAFLDPRKPQTLVIVLDRDTMEAMLFQKAAKGTIIRWAREHGFKHEPDRADLRGFKPNSADLRGIGRNTKMTFVHNG